MENLSQAPAGQRDASCGPADAPEAGKWAYRPVPCAECGADFRPNRPQQQFCSPAHKTAFQNRAAVEGRAVIAFAKAWRASRNRKEDREIGSKALAELCSILDSFNADDRAAGRPAPIHYAKRLLANGGRYMDRTRRAR